ncbi:MAG: hypothetical protein COA79_18875 [Planctomycetota bacterium]|nr:MAG: hypothetical protein COA79_18875 [Planctomycetota bacterium]
MFGKSELVNCLKCNKEFKFKAKGKEEMVDKLGYQYCKPCLEKTIMELATESNALQEELKKKGLM